MTETKEQQTEALTSTTALPLAPSREELGDGVVIVRDVDGVAVLSTKRNRGLAAFLVVFCVFWDVLVAALGMNGALPLFGVPHIGGAIFVTAWLLNVVVNHTRIGLGHGRLRAGRAPLPWPGRVDVALGDVAEFFVGDGKTRQNGAPLPALWVRLHDGERHVVLDPLPNVAHGERLVDVLRAHVDDLRAGG